MHGPESKQNSNIIIRAGQAKSALKTGTGQSALTVENADDDASSIYLTSDQSLPFTPATKKSQRFLYSLDSKPAAFLGAQILVNSDSVILNSKRESIFLFSNNGIHLNSLNGGMTLDSIGNVIITSENDIHLHSSTTLMGIADEDIILMAHRDSYMEAGRNVVLKGNSIYLGGRNTQAQPLVLGTTLKLFFMEVMRVLITTQPLAMMPTGIINPAIIARLQLVYAKYQVLPGPFNPLWASDDNFALKTNELPFSYKAL
jgi:hypothetical protein